MEYFFVAKLSQINLHMSSGDEKWQMWHFIPGVEDKRWRRLLWHPIT
jgi:hypothetical protein